MQRERCEEDFVRGCSVRSLRQSQFLSPSTDSSYLPAAQKLLICALQVCKS
ncbi:hypothetical protein SynROS8604_03066 [Synechococcus sp. ROS8604]|nr:hypothetical protein SynROS8604_03066 [Synechococcus sp. ROS8604]